MRFTAGLAIAALALVACSDDGGPTVEAPTTTAAPAATTTTAASVPDETTETTAPAPDETTTTPTTEGLDEGDGPAIPDNAEDYATALIGAWEAGDAPTAEVFATDEAFDALFAFDPGGPVGTWSLDHCEGAAGSSFCTFTAGGDPTVVVRVLNEPASQSAPDAVVEVQVT